MEKECAIVETCERCLEPFDTNDMFMGMCDDCFKIMYGHDRVCEPFPRKKSFDDGTY